MLIFLFLLIKETEPSKTTIEDEGLNLSYSGFKLISLASMIRHTERNPISVINESGKIVGSNGKVTEKGFNLAYEAGVSFKNHYSELLSTVPLQKISIFSSLSERCINTLYSFTQGLKGQKLIIDQAADTPENEEKYRKEYASLVIERELEKDFLYHVHKNPHCRIVENQEESIQSTTQDLYNRLIANEEDSNHLPYTIAEFINLQYSESKTKPKENKTHTYTQNDLFKLLLLSDYFNNADQSSAIYLSLKNKYSQLKETLEKTGFYHLFLMAYIQDPRFSKALSSEFFNVVLSMFNDSISSSSSTDTNTNSTKTVVPITLFFGHDFTILTILKHLSIDIEAYHTEIGFNSQLTIELLQKEDKDNEVYINIKLNEKSLDVSEEYCKEEFTWLNKVKVCKYESFKSNLMEMIYTREELREICNNNKDIGEDL